MAKLETPEPNLQFISSSKKKEGVIKTNWGHQLYYGLSTWTTYHISISEDKICFICFKSKHFFDKIKLILRSQVRNSTTHLTLIYHHQSKRRSECANSVISNRGTACMSHMSTVDSHSDKRLKGHDTTNSRNLTNISFFEMEKIKFYFGSLTKGSVDENAMFLE